MKPAALILLALLVPTAALAGEIYKWVDASGQVHFSQTPPPRGTYQAVSPAAAPVPEPGSPASAAAAAAQADAEQKFLQEADTAAKAKADAQAKAGADKAGHAQKCADAHAQIDVLDHFPQRRLATQNPDGTVSRMTDEESAARRAAAQKDIDANCGK